MSDEQEQPPGTPTPPPGYAVANNPAGRLRYWLEMGQQRRAEIDRDAAAASQQNRPRNLPFRLYEVWCHIWNLDPAEPHSRLEYARRGIGLVDAADEARELAEDLPDDLYHAKYGLEHFNQIEAAVSAFAESPDLEFPQMFTRINDLGWQSLKILDETLSREVPGPSLTAEVSAGLRKMAQDLIEALVADTELDAALRMDLIAKVREVDEALIKAAVMGTTVVVDSANTLLGLWFRFATTSAKVLNHPITQSILHLMVGVYNATEHSGAMKEIAPTQFTEILGLPPGSQA